MIVFLALAWAGSETGVQRLLDEGRVAQTGTHDELMAEGGLYADLYSLFVRDDSAPPDREARVPDPSPDPTPVYGHHH